MVTSRSVSKISKFFTALVFSLGIVLSVPSKSVSSEITPTTQIECLAQAVYFEARGESVRGMEAVGHAVLNRTTSKGFAKTVCGVVMQKGQFSWVGTGAHVTDQKTYTKIRGISEDLMGPTEREDMTFGATYFHTSKVNPSWSKRMTLTTQIGSHLFYKTRS